MNPDNPNFRTQEEKDRYKALEVKCFELSEELLLVRYQKDEREKYIKNSLRDFKDAFAHSNCYCTICTAVRQKYFSVDQG